MDISKLKMVENTEKQKMVENAEKQDDSLEQTNQHAKKVKRLEIRSQNCNHHCNVECSFKN